ncbi:MAG TPA: DUF2283 domain-containing protein [archaeon]|nr:DUF2283 domain-containing protein [archaeon]
MKVSYDKQANALYIKFSNAKYFESDEIKEGMVLDKDKNGKVIGLEILDASERLPRKLFKKKSFELVEKQIA